MAALCVCDHAREEHTDDAGRCGVMVRDAEFGLYRCTCPAFEKESADA